LRIPADIASAIRIAGIADTLDSIIQYSLALLSVGLIDA